MNRVKLVGGPLDGEKTMQTSSEFIVPFRSASNARRTLRLVRTQDYLSISL